jgi:hypothetical protein
MELSAENKGLLMLSSVVLVLTECLEPQPGDAILIAAARIQAWGIGTDGSHGNVRDADMSVHGTLVDGHANEN